MKVLLVSVNRERMPAPVFPLGLAYIAGSLRAGGHSVEALDLCFSQNLSADLRDLLNRFGPELIGLSLRNLDNLTYPSSISYLPEVEEVISICRRFSTAKIAIGGSGFSLAPRDLFQHLKVDYGIVGEGEEAFLELVEAIEKGHPVQPAPHLLVQGESAPFIRGAKASRISSPDRTLFDPLRYLKDGGMLNLQTKRGCPFSCIYCTYPLLEGKQVRLREVEEVVEEMEGLLRDYGTDYLYFVDDIFNYPPGYAEQLCRRMAQRGIRVRWTAFVNPGSLTEDLLRRMVEAGCDGVEFGTDSGSEKMLRNYRKSFTRKEVIEASQLCAKLRVNHCHYLLFGGPGEDEGTIEETFELMDELDPTAVIAMLGIRIYPNTELERLARAEGMIGDGSKLIFPHFYISPSLHGRLEEIIQGEALKRRQWIVPGLEINITQPLMEQIRRFQVRGPLWELVGRMKKPRLKPLKNL
ncbi:MAG: radical SAM protein [Desulfobacterota bacterium]|nr:radical SAM protein [Thermodesulfobacteriota bacterium]